MTTFLVPFAAGGFIYIASADLISELHKEVEVKKSILQLVLYYGGSVSNVVFNFSRIITEGYGFFNDLWHVQELSKC